MRWPADHPVRTDPALQPWADNAAAVAAGWTGLTVLRHLPGRRSATLVERAGQRAVLKVFASPRARGGARRLAQLEGSSAAGIVPSLLGTDPDGHALMVTYHEGTELDQLPDEAFIAGCRTLGARLRELHDCGVEPDRRWGWRREVELLSRNNDLFDVPAVLVARGLGPDLDGGDWVCAHRDCHPRQAVFDAAGRGRWIDLDDVAFAPRALDIGNMIAHLRRECLRGRRRAAVVTSAEQQFRDGYDVSGTVSQRQLDGWTDVATLRLAVLAVTRHGDPELSRQLLGAVHEVSA